MREPDWVQEDRQAAWSEFSAIEAIAGTGAGAAASGRSVPAAVAAGEVLRVPGGGADTANGGTWFEVAAPAGVTVMPLAQAIARHPDLVRQAFAAAATTADPSRARKERSERDRLDAGRAIAVARAFWTDGVFVYVPDEISPAGPIVLHLPAGGATHAGVPAASPAMASPAILRVVVAVGRHSRATVVETWNVGATGITAPAEIVAATEIIAAEGAEVHFSRVQSLPRPAKAAFAMTGVLERDARLRWTIVDVGGSATFSAAAVALRGEGARTDGAALFVGTGDERRDVRAMIEHEAARTGSEMAIRGALADRAKASFAGHTDISPGAKGTTGRQTVKTLLLSPDARIDALPALEIDDWDVDAGHAASAGSVDETALYYLMSRGIPREIAIAMLVEAFIEPVVQRLPGNEMPRDGMPGNRLREAAAAFIRRKLAGAEAAEGQANTPAEGVAI